MSDRTTRFSIVIATYNRPGQLADCLAALVQQDYPLDAFEVIVVDDGGEADLSVVCARFDERLALKLFRKENGGAALARNHGARNAAGHFLVFTDDDCEPGPDWLSKLDRVLTEYPNAMVGGKTVNRLKDNIFSEASQVVIDLVYAHYNRDPLRARFLATNNLALPREQFFGMGAFDPDFYAGASEDRDLCERWLQGGFQIIYEESAVLWHSHHLGLLSYFKQHFRYGRGAWCFRRKHRSGGIRTFSRDASLNIDPGGWLLYPFRSRHPKPVRLLLALFYWQFANLAGFAWEGLFGHE